MPTQPSRRSAAVLISLLLAACATSKQAILPQGLPSMQEVYERHFDNRRLRNDPGESLREQATDSQHAAAVPAAVQTSAQQVFTRLPNPDLVLYVYPHLAGEEGVPVPGYATRFPLYERVEYALPGESGGR